MAEKNLTSFTKEVKNELANKLWREKEKEEILLGFMLSSKKSASGNIVLSNEIASVIKLIYSILKNDYDIDVKIRHDKHNRITKHIIYEIILPSDALERIAFYKEITECRYSSLIKTSNLQCILTGLFLKSATINDPSHGNYYLGITVDDMELIKRIIFCLDKLPDARKISFKYILHRSHHIIYLKRSEEIGNFLAYIGASVAMLNYENIRLTRDYYNSQNRLNVCDSANYEKSLKTGAENIADIEIIEKYLGLSTLGDKTKKIIELRRQNSDVSYTELTNIATENNITIGRSTIVKIFKDLKILADKCRIYEKN